MVVLTMGLQTQKDFRIISFLSEPRPRVVFMTTNLGKELPIGKAQPWEGIAGDGSGRQGIEGGGEAAGAFVTVFGDGLLVAAEQIPQCLLGRDFVSQALHIISRRLKECVCVCVCKG